jgi:hypothetical protein
MKVGMIGLIATGRHPEEISHWDLMLHCLSEPAINGCRRVGPHKGVFDDVITAVYLAVIDRHGRGSPRTPVMCRCTKSSDF